MRKRASLGHQEARYTRKLSYAFIHGIYWKLMVWPFFLCYDYSMDAIPLIESVREAAVRFGDNSGKNLSTEKKGKKSFNI